MQIRDYRFVTAMLTLFLFVTLSAAATAETTVIHAGQLLAVPGERPATNQTIVVRDGRVDRIVNGFAAPGSFGEDVTFVDLSDMFVLPGLMDMHVHLQGELGPHNDRDTLKMPPQPTTLHLLEGKEAEIDEATGEVRNVNYRYVVYIPWATAESTGLPLKPLVEGGPWIMDPGTHRAHIMITPPR